MKQSRPGDAVPRRAFTKAAALGGIAALAMAGLLAAAFVVTLLSGLVRRSPRVATSSAMLATEVGVRRGERGLVGVVGRQGGDPLDRRPLGDVPGRFRDALLGVAEARVGGGQGFAGA